MKHPRVLLVTSWGQRFCGIQDHSEMLIAAIKDVDPKIVITPSAEALDPAFVQTRLADQFVGAPWDIVHLNYHRALHSRWTPEAIVGLQKLMKVRIAVTFHDTFGELPQADPLSSALSSLVDAFIVHEECPTLPESMYWPMAVPEYEGMPLNNSEHYGRMVLGTIGFDFPWKNYEEMARQTARVGWAFLICCPEMEAAREEQLKQINPHTVVRIGYHRDQIVATLKGCDATAFMYTCGNSGQSAAILQGIAARKPVYALSTCRQFRSLYLDDIGRFTIRWVKTFEELTCRLRADHFDRLDSGITQLADARSWPKMGGMYAALYRTLVSA